MPLGTASELAFMARDSGDRCVLGGSTTYGWLDRTETPVQDDTGAMVNVRHLSFEYPAGTLAGVQIRSVVSISPRLGDGTFGAAQQFSVRDVGPELADGTQRLTLTEVTP